MTGIVTWEGVMRSGRARGRLLAVFISVVALVTLLLPPSALGRTNGKDKITVFLHGFNGQNCTQDWRELMLDMRANGFTGAFYVVKFLSSDSACDLSGIANAQNVSLFEYGAHSNPYGHTGTNHDNNTDIRHLAWHFAHWLRSYIPNDPPIDLVSHSMGGLIVRYALGKQTGDWPALNLEDVVTLGSPHGGVHFASWNDTVQGDQMEPESFFIGWLADNAPNPQGSGGTEWTVMGSAGDVVVMRGTATKMSAAERVRFGWLPWPIGHGEYMHVGGNRNSALWMGTEYQTWYTYGPMPMIRAALQFEGW
jgi:pimeloyl-ACP methyl ester carboxylesterase